jgi:SAM-dependent methyltransferase
MSASLNPFRTVRTTEDDIFTPQLDARCPSCGHVGLQEFARVENVPVHNSLVLADAQAARAFPRGDVALALCDRCGFITNTLFDPSKIHYYQEYEDQQSFSPTFNAFARALASDLIERYGLKAKTVLEVGCGKGDFLALMCELGASSGVGIDPTALEGRLTGPGSDRIKLISDLYSEKYANYSGDFVCCRHTLEHISNTAEFLRTIRRSIGDRLSTPVFLEVPDVLRVLKECAYWDVYYEHCSYFTPGSLARLFAQCGFEVVDVKLGFADQYILLEAQPTAQPQSSSPLPAIAEPVEDVRAAAASYGRTLAKTLARWRQWFAERKAAGERVAVWGSGSKCVSFLTTLGVGDFVDHVVDINPHRHGKFLLGLGIEIESPNSLAISRPDHVVVMNPIYVDEIQGMLNEMRVPSKVIAV